MLSVLTTKNQKQAKKERDTRRLLEVMNLFIIFLVVMYYRCMHTAKLIKLYTSNICSYLTSVQLLKKTQHFSCGQQNLSLSSWLPCPSHCCSVLKWQAPSPRVVEGAWFRMCGGGDVVWAVRIWAGLLGVSLLAIIALVTPVLDSGTGCSQFPFRTAGSGLPTLWLVSVSTGKGRAQKESWLHHKRDEIISWGLLVQIQTWERTSRVTLSLSWMISTFRSSDPSVGALPGLWQQRKTALSPALVEFPPGLRRNTFHISLDHWVAGSSPAFFAVFGT